MHESYEANIIQWNQCTKYRSLWFRPVALCSLYWIKYLFNAKLTCCTWGPQTCTKNNPFALTIPFIAKQYWIVTGFTKSLCDVSCTIHLTWDVFLLWIPQCARVCICEYVCVCAKGPASPLYKQSHLPGLSRSQSDADQEWNAFQSFFTTKSLAWPELCVGFFSTIFLPSVFPHLFVKLNTHRYTHRYMHKKKTLKSSAWNGGSIKVCLFQNVSLKMLLL